jgi:hypothetical protein
MFLLLLVIPTDHQMFLLVLTSHAHAPFGSHIHFIIYFIVFVILLLYKIKL